MHITDKFTGLVEFDPGDRIQIPQDTIKQQSSADSAVVELVATQEMREDVHAALKQTRMDKLVAQFTRPSREVRYDHIHNRKPDNHGPGPAVRRAVELNHGRRRLVLMSPRFVSVLIALWGLSIVLLAVSNMAGTV